MLRPLSGTRYDQITTRHPKLDLVYHEIIREPRMSDVMTNGSDEENENLLLSKSRCQRTIVKFFVGLPLPVGME